MKHALLKSAIVSVVFLTGPAQLNAHAQAVPELQESSVARDVRGGFFNKDEAKKTISPRIDAFSAANNSMVPDIEAPRTNPVIRPTIKPEPKDSFNVSAPTAAAPVLPTEPQASTPREPSSPQVADPGQGIELNTTRREQDMPDSDSAYPQAQEQLYREMSRDESFSNVLRTAEALSQRMNKIRPAPGAPAATSSDFYREALEAVEGVVDESDPKTRRRKQQESNRF